MKLFRTIVAFFQALLTLVAFTFISVVCYAKLSVPFNILLALAFFSLGCYGSWSVFSMMKRRGVITTLSTVHQSPDLDVFEPSESDGVLKLTPEEVRNYFLQNKFQLNPCTVSIFGDWEGRQLNVRHTLKFVQFNPEKSILTLTFSDQCILKIRNPKLIFVTESYLKIVKATEVLWQVPNELESSYQYSYLNAKNKITTKSNTDWKPHQYDLGPGLNAIYLQG